MGTFIVATQPLTSSPRQGGACDVGLRVPNPLTHGERLGECALRMLTLSERSSDHRLLPKVQERVVRDVAEFDEVSRR